MTEEGTEEKYTEDQGAKHQQQWLGFKVGIVMALCVVVAVGLGFGLGLEVGGC